MTYSGHQEEASRALNDLVVSRESHSGEDDEVLLECRRHVIAATRERLTLLGGSWNPSHVRAPTVLTVASRPLQELVTVLDALPRTMPGDMAPTDLLPGPPAAQSLTSSDRWRCAARNVTLANHELTASADQPWVSSNAALWHLAGDLASLVEAVVLLDDRLAHRGAIGRVTPGVRTAQRLIAGDVARLARWFGTDRSSDLAYASPLSQLGLYDGPRIHIVHRPEDLATAQRTLAALLRPRNGDDEPRAGLRAARLVAVGQIRLADVFATWAAHLQDGQALEEQFRRRMPRYEALHRSTVRLVETAPTRSSLAIAQQTEMLAQLRGFGRRIPSADVLADLNDASHDVSVSLGRSLRREGLTRRNVLVLREAGLGLPRPQPITNTREPFHVACKALADDPISDEAKSGQWAGPQRDGLRATLDREPSRLPPPARSLTTSSRPSARRPTGRTYER